MKSLTSQQLRHLSKKLSYILRHQPQSIGLKLDEYGWANVKELLQKLQKHQTKITWDDLEEVVSKNNKQRFAFNEDKTRIRASQGHSIPIKLGYESIEPPEILFHGTAQKYLNSILKEGLEKRNRHHVHLSVDIETAQNVGKRHGKVVILEIQSNKMYHDGMRFFCSENGVWLTNFVPTNYLKVLNIG